jgi:hypothetical protein
MFTHYLKLYGFREVESGHLEFANDDFGRGKSELTLKIEKKYRERFNVALLMARAARPQGETSKALTMAAKEEKASSSTHPKYIRPRRRL